jgi:hypothetical protein
MVKIITTILIVLSLSLGVASMPTTTHAFTLFGIRFFEPEPTPTPTPKPTATPTPTPTPVVNDTDKDGQVLGDQESLPSTGPGENLAVVLAVVAGAFIARKYWQVSHKL